MFHHPPEWRNWQTHQTQNLTGPGPVGVRFPPPANYRQKSTTVNTRTFKKGIHPEEFKESSRDLAIREAPCPPKVIIPLRQHIGAPLQPLVNKGDPVKTGQVIARAEAFVSAPVHSSVTGVVKNIGKYPTPLMASDTCIEIETGEAEEFDFDPDTEIDYTKLKKEEIIDAIRQAGMVGMGGAAFPTAVKFIPPEGISIHTVVLNGCECEPYLTADHRLMLEYPEKILTGLKIILQAVGAEKAVIGIEKNKPDAIAKIQGLCANEPQIRVQAVKTKYPQGAEKMLIDAVLGLRVPPGKLPLHVGVVVSNVGTAAAVYDAVVRKIPLYQRVVTLSGDALKQPANMMVRIGTPFSFLFDHLGGFNGNVGKIIMGGPMMGVTQFNPDVGVTKATSGILVLSSKKQKKEYNCINCAECVYHCPLFLVPTKIVRFARGGIWDKAEAFGALNCIECGTCGFLCPSSIPLVHWIRVAKNRITEIQRTSKDKK
jgi:electron transport complex protein RnfC